MTRPYDLLAFLNQDTRWDNIINLYHDLSQRQALIDKLWSEIKENSDMTSVVAKNEDCIKTGKLNFLDWHASFLEDGKSKNIADEEYMLYQPAFGQDIDVPDCKKISSLTFSMFAFEHLEVGFYSKDKILFNLLSIDWPDGTFGSDPASNAESWVCPPTWTNIKLKSCVCSMSESNFGCLISVTQV